MALKKECAALAALVCGGPLAHHSTDIRAKLRAGTLEAPVGWTVWRETPDIPCIQAKAFVHDNGGCVIAIRGADFFQHALEVSLGADEFITNVALDMSLAGFSQPLVEVATLFAQLRQWLRAQGRDPSSVVFSGHGVGGGLAATLAVWFDQPAIVFAQAPLRAVALAPAEFSRVKAAIAPLLGEQDGALRAMQGFAADPSGVMSVRARRCVHHWFVQGEIFSQLRSPATSIEGSEHPIDAGMRPRTVDDAMALHDMKLHAALVYDPRLPNLCQISPGLLPLFIHRDNSNLLDTFINDQHRVGLRAESSLQRFVKGLERMASLEEDKTS